MGGDHGHHHKIEVPDYRIYKVEDCPKLLKVQRALAQKGLKDPWLRFVIWHFWFLSILYISETGCDEVAHMFGVHLL
jgi:hypothetical protein